MNKSVFLPYPEFIQTDPPVLYLKTEALIVPVSRVPPSVPAHESSVELFAVTTPLSVWDTHTPAAVTSLEKPGEVVLLLVHSVRVPESRHVEPGATVGGEERAVGTRPAWGGLSGRKC